MNRLQVHVTVLLFLAPYAPGNVIHGVCKRVADATNHILPGTPPGTLAALGESFYQHVTSIVTSMENQVAGRPTLNARPVVVAVNQHHSRTEHQYLIANYNHAVNTAVAPVMEANSVAPSQLKPSKTLVVVVHQWGDTPGPGGQNLQAETAKTIKDKFPGEPVLVVSSDVFALRNPALLGEVKRQGALVFSYDGRILHTDEAGKEIHRDVTIDADKLVFAGGQVTECLKRTIQDSIRMAMARPARKTLEVQLLTKQSYDLIQRGTSQFETVDSSYSSGKDRFNLALGFNPDRKVWLLKDANHSRVMDRLRDEGTVTFVHKDTKQEFTIDFNQPS